MNRPNSRLRPSPTGLTRSHRIAPASADHRAGRAQQRRVYAALDAEEWCAACGCSGPLDHSHILSQKQHPALRNNPLNWLMLCRGCHELFEHNKAGFAHRYPAAFAEKMRRMQLLDRQAYAFFRMKNPTLFP